jgi:hypothetical protein
MVKYCLRLRSVRFKVVKTTVDNDVRISSTGERVNLADFHGFNSLTRHTIPKGTIALTKVDVFGVAVAQDDGRLSESFVNSS